MYFAKNTVLSLPVEPLLRSFARAVTTDQFAGDELTRAVLAELAREGRMTFQTKADAFRVFIEKWREAASRDSAPLFTDAALIRSLGEPPSEARLVLLLSDAIGFPKDAVIEIIGSLSQRFEALLAEGRGVIGSRPGARAVIVEDEPLIAADLADILQSMGVEVAGAARTAEAGARIAAEEKPDIVLADYNLDGDKTGVDAILTMQERHTCPVVFITGYPDDVLKGEAVEPDFVIVKPYRPEAVRAIVAHCLDTDRYGLAA